MIDKPVVVLNLLKFKSRESLDSRFEYATNFVLTFGSRGAEVLYCGKLMEKVQIDKPLLLLRRGIKQLAFFYYSAQKHFCYFTEKFTVLEITDLTRCFRPK